MMTPRTLLTLALVTCSSVSTMGAAGQEYQFMTIASVNGLSGARDGVGPEARFCMSGGNAFLRGMAVDAAGNVYLAESLTNLVRKIAPVATVTTLAGTGGLYEDGTEDGLGPDARFHFPEGVAVALDGTVYVADTYNSAIRKITPGGRVTTFAGVAGHGGGQDGSGAQARFRSPTGIAVNRAGTVYVADTGNMAIRQISPSGVVTTLAGTLAEYNNSGNTEGTGAAAKFYSPHGLALDAAGNLYVADTSNHAIRRITPGGLVSTFAGKSDSSFGHGADDGVGSAARFRYPLAVAVDADGILYVADSGNHTIRRVTAGAAVTTIGGAVGQTGNVDGAGAAARFFSPSGIVVNSAGELYIFDGGSFVLRKGVRSEAMPVGFSREPANASVTLGGTARFEVVPTGLPTLFTYRWQRAPAGTEVWADLQDGGPYGGSRTAVLTVRADAIGTQGDRFRAVVATTAGVTATTTAAGLTVKEASAYAFTRVEALSSFYGSVDGKGGEARVGEPEALVFGPDGNLYFADALTPEPRRISLDGTVTTLRTGSPVGGIRDGSKLRVGFGVPGSRSYFHGTQPGGLAIDAGGNLYVADWSEHVIRKIAPGGTSVIIAGRQGEAGTADGVRALARFTNPSALVVDAAGNLYVADTGNCTIRKVAPDGGVTTVAGQAGTSGNVDGAGGAARFNQPRGLVLERSGSLIVADTQNHELRRISPSGTVMRLAGSGFGGLGDGKGAEARFRAPSGLALDTDGSILVADTGNHVIRRVTADGVVTTLFGQLGASESGRAGLIDGSRRIVEFREPSALAVDADGTIYVADKGNHVVRKISSAGETSTFVGRAGGVSRPRSVAVGPDGTLVVCGASPDPVLRLSPTGVLSFLTDSFWSDSTDAATVAADGVIYLVNSNGWPLQRILPNGIVQEDRTSPPNSFGFPISVAVDRAFTMHLVDKLGPILTRVRDGGDYALSIGSQWEAGSADGAASVARFRSPTSIAVSDLGETYVADTGNHTIRKVATDGKVSTLAGQAAASGSSDGLGSAARFSSPRGVAVDGSGFVYVADTDNRLIRRISPAGEVKTIGGLAGAWGRADGVGSTARFASPVSVAVSREGIVYVADLENGEIRQGRPVAASMTTPTVTLPTSVDVTYGDSLSAAQLGATANVPGTFVYTPVLGSIMTADHYRVRTTFIPTDETRYVRVSSETTVQVNRPIFLRQPDSLGVTEGKSYELSPSVWGYTTPPSAQWYLNGTALGGANTLWLALTGAQVHQSGLYTAELTSGQITLVSDPAIVGISTTRKVTGAGREVGSDIFVASNGNTFDQVLLEGAAAAITADSAQDQITRLSYIDLDDDIVQVELSGPGTLSLVLANASGPAQPVRYNQSVAYMKGHAGIVITGSTEKTNVSVFSVGRVTAVNQSLFQAGVTYDGIADIAFIAIASGSGKFGGVRTANAHYFAAKGLTGLYAPRIEFSGPVYLGDVTAYDNAVPVLLTGQCGGATMITGGGLNQENGHTMLVSGLTRLQFGAGTDSHGNLLPAQANRAVLEQNGQDVTATIVETPK